MLSNLETLRTSNSPKHILPVAKPWPESKTVHCLEKLEHIVMIILQATAKGKHQEVQ